MHLHIEASESYKLTIDAGAGWLYGEDVPARLLQNLQLGNTKSKNANVCAWAMKNIYVFGGRETHWADDSL